MVVGSEGTLRSSEQPKHKVMEMQDELGYLTLLHRDTSLTQTINPEKSECHRAL